MITARAAQTPLQSQAIELSFSDLLRGVITWLRVSGCRLHGHELRLHFEWNRICLKCADCGFETRGWCLESARRV
jgi:hypothetical protein